MEIKLDLDRLRKYKLFIATPMYGGNCVGLYTKSILDLQALLMQHGIENRFSFLFNESLITRARNYLADEFLRSGFTHLLFIDSDIEFNPMDVLALLHFDKEIAGSAYPKKTVKWDNVKKAIQNHPDIPASELENVIGDYVFNMVPGTKEFKTIDLVEVMEIGTGFMLIKREVFDKLMVEYPHLRYKPDHAGQQNFDGSRYIHAFFDTVIDPESHRYLSEDYFLCKLAREIGIKIWYCPWMRTTHVGTYGFKGNLPAIAHYVGSL